MQKYVALFLSAVLAVSCHQNPVDTGGFAIHRGVNIAHWLSQSQARGAEREAFFTEADIQRIAGWGFDHVRIPVDEEQMFHEDGSKDEEAFALLHRALGQCGRHGLRAVVDLHILRSHYFDAEVKPLFTDEAAQEAFYECWRKLSGELRGYSTSAVAYELMNEPVADDPEDWNRIVRRCHAVIRGLEKDRVIVIGSNRWQSFDTASQLAIPEGDPNIILSFHYYNPFFLTHNGAPWTRFRGVGCPAHYPGPTVDPEELAARPEAERAALSDWLGQSYGKDRLAAEFGQVVEVARRHCVPVYCGEYGCLAVEANEESRHRWLADMNEVFDSLGIARSVWCYREGRGGFGILQAPSSEPDRRMLDALLK